MPLLVLLLLLGPCSALAVTDGSTVVAERGSVGVAEPSASQPRADPFTGAVELALPIAVPPGTGGVQPSLALVYSSAGRRDSWVGAGWSLALGVIQRSLDSGVPAYAPGDTFEWNGEELLPDPNDPTRYHTRRESFARIRRVSWDAGSATWVPAANGSAWEVRPGDGSVARFGANPGTSASRVAGGVAGEPFAWLLDEREDPHGNALRVVYDARDPGVRYPSEIRYTLRRTGGVLESLDPANPDGVDRVVRFDLEARPDESVDYAAGIERRLGHRLAAIEVRVGGAPYRRTELAYLESADSFRSLLYEVREYGADFASAVPTPPRVTTFDYTSNVAGGDEGWMLDPSSPWALPAGVAFVRADYADGGTRLADLDGDGRVDAVRQVGVDHDGNPNTVVVPDAASGVYVNSAAGFAATPDPGWSFPASGFFAVETTTGERGSNALVLADFDADARPDLIGAFAAWRVVLDFFGAADPVFHHLEQRHRNRYDEGAGSPWQTIVSGLSGALLPGNDGPFTMAESSLFQSFDVDGNGSLVELDGDGCPDLLVRAVRARKRPLLPAQEDVASYYRLGDCAGGFSPTATDRFGLCDLTDPSPTARNQCRLEALLVAHELRVEGTGATAEVRFTETRRLGKRFFDVNGDGLDDQLTGVRSAEAGFGLDPGVDPNDPNALFALVHTSAAIHRGTDFAPAPSWAPPVAFDAESLPLGRLVDRGVRAADLNGDGRLDLIQARLTGGDPNDPATAGAARVWLNTGRSSDPWLELPPGSPWQVPAGMEFVEGDGRDRGVRLADLDGDGMVDLVRSFGSEREVWLARGSPPDLLWRVTSPRGGQTRLSYVPSSRWDNMGGDGVPDLPYVRPVISEVETDDGRGGVWTTQLLYSGGLFDPARRELRGFREVVSVAPDDSRQVTRFHQDEARAGLVESVTVEDAAGTLLRRTEYSYTADSNGAPWVSQRESVTLSEYDGAPTPRRIRTELGYDSFGNPAWRIEWGEVDGAGADVDPSDTRSTELSYAPPDDALYQVDRLERSVVRRGPPATGVELRESLLYYDARGSLTRSVAVLGDPVQPDPTTDFAYDAYGNLISVTSPRASAGQGGGTQYFEYDGVLHTLRTASVNALGHRREWDHTAAGCRVTHPTGAGLVHAERGPNELATGLEWRRCYDAFGRIELEVGPAGEPSTRWSYDSAQGLRSVTRRTLATASGGERVSVARSDGLGRVFETEADAPLGRTVVVQRSYDGLGRVVRATAPHFSGDAPLETEIDYDVLGRVVRLTAPGGRTTLATFDRGWEEVTDPTGRRTRRLLGPFGRLRRVEEELSPGDVRATTWSYDALGQLTAVTDSAGNRTDIEYDALGRRTRIVDPDSGPSELEYDADGNVVRTTNALGVELTSVFDALGRRLERHIDGALQATWTWDQALGGIGRLSQREDDAGRYRVDAYDPRGLAALETYEIAGVALGFTTVYNSLGQVVSRSYPSGERVEWRRDGAGFLASVETAGGEVLATGIDWDARGGLASWTSGGGVSTEYLPDAGTGRLRLIRVARGTELLASDLYLFALDNRITRVVDLLDPGRNRTFDYDALGRLREATGPYGVGGMAVALHYVYDALGNLTCKAASDPVSCAGGRTLVYPSVPGAPRPHAPLAVDGLAASYSATGNLEALGARDYVYDALGRLVRVVDAGRTLVDYAYDAEGRRAASFDFAGGRPASRPLELRAVTRDFEWDRTRALATIRLRLGGALVAQKVDPFVPASLVRSGSVGSYGLGPAPRARFAVPLAAGLAGLGALALGVQLARLRRRGNLLPRPTVAGATALGFWLAWTLPARALLPDGDLNADGRIDAADVLLAARIGSRELAPTAQQLARGDVAPLELAPQTPPLVDAGDTLLIARAAQGEDVDGDGLDADAELALGASPFRRDSDRDGLTDPLEAALGTDPADPDSDGDGIADGAEDNDGDGLLDGAEAALGTDAWDGDTDGDGVPDGIDPLPRSGVIYQHADHLGSPLLRTSAGGALVERVLYRPYGERVRASLADEVGFTGQPFAASTGLYDYGARWYDPALGRFLQPDPLVPAPDNPQSLNRYAYVWNDPVNRIDPRGTRPLDWLMGWLGAVGGTAVGLGRAALGGLHVASSLAVHDVLPFSGRVVRTAATSAAALGVAGIIGPIMDVVSAFTQSDTSFAKAEAAIRETGAVPVVTGGVASGAGNRSYSYVSDFVEFALFDNVGAHFPSVGRRMADGLDPFGDAQIQKQRISTALEVAHDAGTTVELRCSSQGCPKQIFALLSIAEGPLAPLLGLVHLEAYGAAARLPGSLRGQLGGYYPFTNRGDPVGRLFGEPDARVPPGAGAVHSVPLPPLSHEFRVYFNQCGRDGFCR